MSLKDLIEKSIKELVKPKKRYKTFPKEREQSRRYHRINREEISIRRKEYKKRLKEDSLNLMEMVRDMKRKK